MKTFVLPETARDAMLERMTAFLRAALPGKRIEVAIKPYVRKRTLEQNAYLFGVVYPTILRELPEDMRGRLQADDLHQLMLMRHFGSHTFELAGEIVVRPARTSSKLTTTEFSEYVESVRQFGAEHGIYVPDPNEPT